MVERLRQMIGQPRDLIDLILEDKGIQREFDQSRIEIMVQHLRTKNKIKGNHRYRKRILCPITNCLSRPDKSQRIKTKNRMVMRPLKLGQFTQLN